MAWKTTQRYSPIHSTASSRRHNWKVHLGILFYIMLLLSFCCAIPLLIHFFARPDNGEWYPPNVMCATCEEMDTHNPALLEYAHNGVEMACRGPTNYVSVGRLISFVYRLIEGVKRENAGLIDVYRTIRGIWSTSLSVVSSAAGLSSRGKTNG
ncbi:uncharacterized protein K460DRAFT_83757 [Cucurbitaria berberidis CBS 394.84]|uniref:Uncharacterized protein n=1 Tax=Cucurbitaria berberidis CBS 394.84 TaxID=1168544 RepID=A0A9P4GPS5_9PLEO|nr:uncharacterized protein K460DRAFT_83757 [Cucurbitaria berberidis CBS 394.84]KAF1848980.1 hypothetical protein K460DRAFT_83757 [Cucurbitaria berberidis CBS 394.84]